MSKKKILFISPTPTHPGNAGNRQHIKSLVGFFKEQNWEVHFLYLAYESYDKETMSSYFGDNLTIVTKEKIFQNKKALPYIFKKLISVLTHNKRKLQLLLGTITKEEYLYNNEVDNYFSVFVKPVIEELRKKHRYKIVVCEYAYLSKALTYFDSTAFKILDTHDIFTNRFKIYLNNNIKPRWVSLYEDQEKKALRRANLILAVNKTDAEYFSKQVTHSKVIQYIYIPESTNLPYREPGKKLLYIASGNDINLAAITSFIKTTFPLILKQNPNALLIIGGNICDLINDKHSNIILKGEINKIDDFYAMGDIVINPETSGTGYKVKSLEALAYGMPLVATAAGAVGVAEPFREHLFIAGDPVCFAKTINKLFEQRQLMKATSANARKWVEEYNEKLTENLWSHLPA